MPPRATSSVPPGDDAAAWSVEAGVVVATVDTLAEGTHWRRDTMSLADAGWRAIATSVSDLAAMGADPGYVLIALEIGDDESLEDLDALADGVAEACACFGVRVAGGNVASTGASRASARRPSGAAASADALLRRDAARAGDLVAVSGAPGTAAAGLALIEDEREPASGARRSSSRRTAGRGRASPSDARRSR